MLDAYVLLANALDLSINFTPVNAYSVAVPLGQVIVNV